MAGEVARKELGGYIVEAVQGICQKDAVGGEGKYQMVGECVYIRYHTSEQAALST